MTTRWKKRIATIPMMLLLISACSPGSSPEPPITAGETIVVSQEAIVPTSTIEPTHTTLPLQDSGGPFLLLQTGVGTYSIFDFADLSITPFDPPGPDQQYNLAGNLSPGGAQMLFPVREGETDVYSFITGETQTTYNFEIDSSIFSPDAAVTAAREALPGMKYSDESLLSAVKNAFRQSIESIQWFQSDRYRLTVLPADETSTQLTLDDHQTGTRTALENQPGLVESFWIGPTWEKILLKKGFMFEPGVWQDDRYYLVDVMKRQAEPIILPENADNARVFWFSPTKIGIIHHPAPSGGTDFSLMDVATMEIVQVVSGPFIGVYPLGTHLLTLHHDQQTQTSSLKARSMNSQDIFFTQTITGQCFVNVRVDDRRLLFNCEEESILVEEDALALTPFGKPVFLFVRSPNRSRILKVSKDGQTSLLNGALDIVQKIALEEDPLEILWLPDSSGFLYRTARSLYLYQIASETNTFLLESDLFGDYRNLNAVWIHLEE